MSIIAGTNDSEEDVAPVAAELGFPVAYGVTRETGDKMGSWWAERRNHIKPSEFLITEEGRVMSSTYSSSPVGRMDPEETLVLTKMIASHAKGK